MIVTIDGPAGAGKSTTARKLAACLNFVFLDTGAMYRAVALVGLEREIDWSDRDQVARVAHEIKLELRGATVLVNGQDVSDRIRTEEVTSVTRHVADNPEVRRRLVELQRKIAEGKSLVSEGRDQGTVAFPQADCKIYLTAAPMERARRRLEELTRRGATLAFDEVLDAQNQRDQRDLQRPVGRLAKAADAIEFNTDGLAPDQVLDQLEQIVRNKMSSAEN